MSVHLSRARWFALTGVALISSGLGFTGAKILANESIAYIAHYKWLVLMIIGVPLVLGLLLTGAILNLFGRTRWFGFLGVTAGVLIVASSFASFKIFDALGQVQYKLEQIVFIGPDVKADLIVIFKRDVTQDQIKYF